MYCIVDAYHFVAKRLKHICIHMDPVREILFAQNIGLGRSVKISCLKNFVRS